MDWLFLSSVTTRCLPTGPWGRNSEQWNPVLWLEETPFEHSFSMITNKRVVLPSHIMKICTCMWIWRSLPHIQILWSFGSFPHLKGDNIKESYYPDNLSIRSEGLHLVFKGEWELWIRYPWMSSGQGNADCISKELCTEREVAHTQIKTIKTPLRKYSNETPSVFTGFALFTLSDLQ